MKKIIILLIALGISGTLFAQVPAFCIGPKIGYNTAKLSDDASTISSELKSNFQFGAFVRIGDKIYIQPEVNYVTKGGQLKSNDPSNPVDQTISVKTLTIPLLLGVKIIDLKLASVHLVGGPVASYALKKDLSVTDPGGSWPVNSKDDIKNASWAIQAGAGVDLMMFTLDIRYEIGMSQIYNGTSDFSLKNNLLNVSLGLKLF
jgi:hypothetical protein